LSPSCATITSRWHSAWQFWSITYKPCGMESRMSEARGISDARGKARRKGRAKGTPPASQEAAAARNRRARWWIYPAAIAVALYVAFQLYAPALSGPLVLDDTFQPYPSPGFNSALRAWI